MRQATPRHLRAAGNPSVPAFAPSPLFRSSAQRRRKRPAPAARLHPRDSGHRVWHQYYFGHSVRLAGKRGVRRPGRTRLRSFGPVMEKRYYSNWSCSVSKNQAPRRSRDQDPIASPSQFHSKLARSMGLISPHSPSRAERSLPPACPHPISNPAANGNWNSNRLLWMRTKNQFEKFPRGSVLREGREIQIFRHHPSNSPMLFPWMSG